MNCPKPKRLWARLMFSYQRPLLCFGWLVQFLVRSAGGGVDSAGRSSSRRLLAAAARSGGQGRRRLAPGPDPPLARSEHRGTTLLATTMLWVLCWLLLCNAGVSWSKDLINFSEPLAILPEECVLAREAAWLLT